MTDRRAPLELLTAEGVTFEVAMAKAADGSYIPPQWVQITPRGRVTARDGREFHFDPERLAASFVEGGIFLPIDFAHEQEYASTLGAKPSRGWIVELQARPEGLFGKVEWLAEAASALAARAYRYISPTFWRDPDGITARLLKGAALVSSPALGMPAIASAQAAQPGKTVMQLPAEIASALGISESASIADAVARIKAMSAGNLDPATANAMAVLVRELNEARFKATNRQVTQKVDAAVASGTIPPALKDWALSLCASDEGAFDAFVEKAGGTFAFLRREATYVDLDSPGPVSSTEASIAAQLGVDLASMKS